MYAVGMLFYKLVTGVAPYADDDPRRVAERKAQEPRPDLPDRVSDHVKPVFHRLISPDPDRRPTASRVVSVLDLIETTA
jgi:serine/threonine protein kinase